MGYMIEISESKVDKLAEHAEGAIRHIGKLMQCIDELSGDHFNERGNYGRYAHSPRMGRGEDRDWDEDEEYDRMDERRGRSSRTGRYIRR